MARSIVVQATCVTESEEAAARALEIMSRSMIGLALDGQMTGTGVTITTTDEEGEAGA